MSRVGWSEVNIISLLGFDLSLLDRARHVRLGYHVAKDVVFACQNSEWSDEEKEVAKRHLSLIEPFNLSAKPEDLACGGQLDVSFSNDRVWIYCDKCNQDIQHNKPWGSWAKFCHDWLLTDFWCRMAYRRAEVPRRLKTYLLPPDELAFVNPKYQDLIEVGLGIWFDSNVIVSALEPIDASVDLFTVAALLLETEKRFQAKANEVAGVVQEISSTSSWLHPGKRDLTRKRNR